MPQKLHSHDARQVLARLNLNVSLIADGHELAVLSDLRQLAEADTELEEAAFEKRKETLLATYGFAPDRERVREKPFAFAEGTAIIPVHGTLINRFNSSWGFVTGYNFIRSQLNMALADDDVERMIFDTNSYGGEAAGCFELAAEVAAAAKIKPIMSVVDASAYSAAYATISGTEIVVTPSGGAGSIGVIAMHVSVEEALKKIGVEVTIFRGGEFKAEGNAFEKLTEGAKERIQASIEKAYKMFTSLVAENRAMDEKKIRDTKARVYRADEALELGLIDRVETPSAAIASFVYGSDEEEEEMADQNKGAAATEVTSEQKAAIIAESNARIKGITTCEEAKGREALANHFAFETSMSVDEAKAALAVAPKAEAAAPAPKGEGEGAEAGKSKEQPGNATFAAAMDKNGTPGVGAGQGGEAEKPSRAKASIALLGIPDEGQKSRAQRALN